MKETAVIKVNNTAAIRQALSGNNLMDIAKAGSHVIQSNARTYAPVDTGNLKASIQAEPDEQSAMVAWARIGTNVIYARIQEFGGWIKPKTKKMLSWIGSDGKRVFAHAVHIPAQPYLRPAVDNHRNEIVSVVAAMVNTTIERVT